MLLLAFIGCDRLPDLVDLARESLFEVRDTPTEVLLSGYIYTSPAPQTGDEVLTEGSLLFEDPEGAWSTDGALYNAERYPGYWVATLPVDAPMQIRVEGEGLYPTLWHARSPSGDGYWSGVAVPVEGAWPGYALFGFGQSFTDGVFSGLGESFGVTVPALTEDTVAVWGAMADPEAAAGQDLRVTCGDGAEASVLALSLDEERVELSLAEDGPITYFFAWGCAPGEVRVAAGEAETLYITQGGEIIAPWFFEVDE